MPNPLTTASRIASGFSRLLQLKLGSDRPFGCSIAPTGSCNLKCKHCYEQFSRNEKKKKKDLSPDETKELVRRLYEQGARHCTITDGEPLLDRASREKCEIAIDQFWITYIVTNGTKEIPDWPVLYVVSIDGPKRVHDSIRGDGVFDRLRKNLKDTPAKKLFGLCTVNNHNRGLVRETLETAQRLGLQGIMFNWHNPLSQFDPLWVNFEHRNENIDEIMDLKVKFGDYILNTSWELELLRTPDWSRFCPHKWIVSYDSTGKLKKPCVFDKLADCERCGCHVFPALWGSVNNFMYTVENRLLFEFMDEFWFDMRLHPVERAHEKLAGPVKKRQS
jgi:organic radical activating enzyme